MQCSAVQYSAAQLQCRADRSRACPLGPASPTPSLGPSRLSPSASNSPHHQVPYQEPSHRRTNDERAAALIPRNHNPATCQVSHLVDPDMRREQRKKQPKFCLAQDFIAPVLTTTTAQYNDGQVTISNHLLRILYMIQPLSLHHPYMSEQHEIEKKKLSPQ
ncbi:hypothetical protein BO86DRAFT_66560 [Aspergillus japonicus CBS 114.51]|uniref:Uncharacterized protein n=1 Tax=Aspergillus japonicus CBS 114.51 TaxID=1448312 RepID=A0A8T8X5A2_ASPJA|nr:hypothetical protein BO86DRAFT_66560 [Aspergillus japonicus CBS 114.51]RAH82679.1 hypothetical protein BO86DRAFT_66560 [Aspergillus japonicus CBS 114.51]